MTPPHVTSTETAGSSLDDYDCDNCNFINMDVQDLIGSIKVGAKTLEHWSV